MTKTLTYMNLNISILGILFVMIMSICSCKTEVKVVESDCLQPDYIAGLSFYETEYKPVKELIRLPGKVTYNADKVVKFVPLFSGVVVNMNYSLGDYVRKGQILAEIQSSDLLAMNNELKTAKSNLQIAERNKQVAQRQFNDGFVSEQKLLKAIKEYEVAGNKVKKYEALLSLYGGDSESGRFYIKSPTSGYVVENKISTGMQIYPESDAIFTISDLDEVWVVADIYTALVQKVKQGMQAEIRTTAYRDTVFTGSVTHVSNVFDKDRRVLQARIVLPNKEVLLKPGMFVDILIYQGNGQDMAIAVPNEAIIFENNKKHVVVYHDECNVEIRKVEELTKIGGKTFIAKGLKENEKIVINNALYLFHEFSK